MATTPTLKKSMSYFIAVCYSLGAPTLLQANECPCWQAGQSLENNPVGWIYIDSFSPGEGDITQECQARISQCWTGGALNSGTFNCWTDSTYCNGSGPHTITKLLEAPQKGQNPETRSKQ